jgi:MFS family permease
MKLRRPTIGNVLRTHELLSNLNGVAMYAVGTAASASPAAGILSFLFYRSVAAGHIGSLRSAVALFTLALMLKAVRRRSQRMLAFAGAMTALAMLTSLDYGTYALVALLVTSVILRSKRGVIGVLAVAIPIALILAINGIFGDAIGRTLALLENTAAYNIGFVTLPQPVLAARYFPEVLLGFLERTAFFYALWLIAVVFLATVPLRRRVAPLFIVACFMIACGVSYAERHHLYQQFAGVPFVFAGTAMLLRMRNKACGYLAAALLVIVAGITPQFAVMSMLRTHEGPLDDSVVALDGALFNKADAARVVKLRTFFAQNLGPTETFFDFTNRALLYFLLDRRCPVPLNEVACYEPAYAQREVIARLERSPEVRYALVPVHELDTAIDGIPNATRAPLVWAYVQQHFALAFNDGDVAIWKRRD